MKFYNLDHKTFETDFEFHNWMIFKNPFIVGYFVTLFFPDLYTDPKYTDVGLKVVRSRGLIKLWKQVQ